MPSVEEKTGLLMNAIPYRSEQSLLSSTIHCTLFFG